MPLSKGVITMWLCASTCFSGAAALKSFDVHISEHKQTPCAICTEGTILQPDVVYEHNGHSYPCQEAQKRADNHGSLKNDHLTCEQARHRWASTCCTTADMTYRPEPAAPAMPTLTIADESVTADDLAADAIWTLLSETSKQGIDIAYKGAAATQQAVKELLGSASKDEKVDKESFGKELATAVQNRVYEELFKGSEHPQKHDPFKRANMVRLAGEAAQHAFMGPNECVAVDSMDCSSDAYTAFVAKAYFLKNFGMDTGGAAMQAGSEWMNVVYQAAKAAVTDTDNTGDLDWDNGTGDLEADIKKALHNTFTQGNQEMYVESTLADMIVDAATEGIEAGKDPSTKKARKGLKVEHAWAQITEKFKEVDLNDDGVFDQKDLDIKLAENPDW